MQPLDLSIAPPRPPRVEIAGVVLLARSIDKVRASLPGGTMGDYRIPGFTEVLLTTLGITLPAFTDAVARAAGDDDVAGFVLANSTQEKRDEWNAYARNRLPRGGDREAAILLYPWLSERPELPLALDVLEEDDRRSFGVPG